MPTTRKGNDNVKSGNETVNGDGTNVPQTEQMFFDRLVKKSIATLGDHIASETIPAATRLAAARTVLELAGMLGPGRKIAAERDAADLSDDELRASIERRQAVLASRAKPVSAPNQDDDMGNLLKELG